MNIDLVFFIDICMASSKFECFITFMAKRLFDSLKIRIAFEFLIIFRPNRLFYQLHICLAGPPESLTTWLFAGPPGDRREGRKSRSRGLASIDPKFISQVRILLRYRDRVKEFIVDLVICSWKRPALFLVSVDNISVALHDLGHVGRGDLGTCGAMEGWFGAYSNTCHSNQSGFSVGVQWADGAKILSSGTSLHVGECLVFRFTKRAPANQLGLWGQCVPRIVFRLFQKSCLKDGIVTMCRIFQVGKANVCFLLFLNDFFIQGYYIFKILKNGITTFESVTAEFYCFRPKILRMICTSSSASLPS